jgi:hypothetical protein
MKPKNFNLALEIISDSHSVELIINQPINTAIIHTGNNPSIHIRNCPASVINNLRQRNFSLSMSDGLLSVEDYSIQ